ncbi:MAG: chemotaxis protein CheC [Lachnospiraceae bacterium]
MAIQSLNDLNAMHLDVLTEIGNIGSGNAATALATLVNTVVDIEVPTIRLIDFSEVSDYLGDKDTVAVGMGVVLEGDVRGMMLQVMQLNFVQKLVNTFYPKDLKSIDDIVEMDMSVLREASNITTAAYVNSLASMTGLFINISPPTDYTDTIDNILKIPASNFSSIGKQALFIDEKLTIGGTEVKSSMILVLEVDSLKTLFDKLSITY